MKYLIGLSVILILVSCSKQKDEVTPKKEEAAPKNEETYFVAVEETPEPVGGIQAIMKNVVYPKEAKDKGIQGRVFVKAFIDENGDVVRTEIIRGTKTSLDTAAENAVKRTKFVPGKQSGEKVKVQVAVPIVFKLK